MEQVIRTGVGGTVYTYHWADEAKVAGTSLSNVTCIVYDEGGSAIVASQSVTPAVDGKMSVTISSTVAGTAREWCRAHFAYTYSNASYVKDVWFHIAITDFDIDYHYDKLVKMQPGLAGKGFSGDTYYSGQRDTAVDILYARLNSASRKPWKVLNQSALEIAFGHLWACVIYDAFALSRGGSPQYYDNARECERKFEEEFGRVNLVEADIDTANVYGDEPKPMTRTRLVRG